MDIATPILAVIELTEKVFGIEGLTAIENGGLAIMLLAIAFVLGAAKVRI